MVYESGLRDEASTTIRSWASEGTRPMDGGAEMGIEVVLVPEVTSAWPAEVIVLGRVVVLDTMLAEVNVVIKHLDVCIV